MWMLLLFAMAGASDRPGQSLTWELTVDGVHVGWRQVSVHWADAEHRVFTGHTSLDGRRLEDRGLRRLRYEQHLSANSQQGRPASFTSVIDAGRGQREIQGRRTGITWTITVIDGGEARTHSLAHTRVDLSTVDLMDPEAERGLSGRTKAQVLLTETGKIEQGVVRALGAQAVLVAEERVVTDRYEWVTSQGVYRFWYAPNGWLVRWEAPMFGVQVHGELVGEAPRGTDEFPVPPAAGPIDVVDL